MKSVEDAVSRQSYEFIGPVRPVAEVVDMDPSEPCVGECPGPHAEEVGALGGDSCGANQETEPPRFVRKPDLGKVGAMARDTSKSRLSDYAVKSEGSFMRVPAIDNSVARVNGCRHPL